MDITHAHVQTLRKIYAGERLNLSQFTINRKRNDGVMTELSASDAYSLRDDERRIYFNIC